MIHESPQATAKLVTGHGVSDLPTDRVGHVHGRGFVGLGDEVDSQWPTLSPTGRRGEERELASGSNPTGHNRLDRQLVATLVTTGL